MSIPACRALRLERLEDRLAPAMHIWTGALNPLWSMDANWVGGSPAGDANADLVFPPNARNIGQTVNDLPDLTIHSITFAGGGYSLVGNPFTLNAGVMVTHGIDISNRSAIFTNIELGAAQSFSVTNPNIVLEMAGLLTGAVSASLSKEGAGILALDNSANSYAGATITNGGILQIGSPNSIPGTSAVSVAAGALLDLNNFSDTIASLAGNGDVRLGIASLTTGGDNTSTTFNGTISGNGSLTKTGTGTFEVDGANTYTGGTTLMSGIVAVGNDSAFGSGSVLFNNATLVASKDTTLANPFKIGDPPIIGGSNNLTFTGTITVTAGNTLTVTNTAITTFAGSITIAAGATLDFDNGESDLTASSSITGMGSVSFSGGTANISGGYDLTGSTTGTQVIGGTANFLSPVTSLGNALTISSGLANAGGGAPLSVPTVVLSGGVLTGGDSITVSSQLSWSGGTMNGSGSINVDAGTQGQAQLVISGDLPKSIADTRVVNIKPAGHITWMGSGGIWMSGKGMVNNQATTDTEDGNHFVFKGVSGDTPQVINGGTFNSNGTITVDSGIMFGNSGTVQILSGTLNIGDDYSQDGGTTTVANGTVLTAGGTVQITGGSLAVFGVINGNVVNAGLLYGTGTVNGNVTNAGQLNPGDTGTTGILTINGDYMQTATGTLNIRIGGTSPGTGYDQLAISGNATLDGTLNVTLMNFTPQSADTFQIMTFGSNANATMFAAVNLDLTIFNPPSYNANDVTLQAI